jgi:cytochrome c oxidase accessory protein FixG
MFDSDTMIITYDRARGEPRGGRARSVDARSAGLGDCVDCGICVQVCPTGIDIREGLQYECIGCAACIDGCNQVMKKMGYSPGLIRYSTENALRGGWSFGQMVKRAFRPRVLVYTAILSAITLGAAGSLVLRVPLKVDVIRDRGSLAREVEGRIENVYRLQIMNTEETPHRYRIRASGIPTLALAGEDVVEVPAASVRMVPVRLRIEADEGHAGSRRIEFEIEALEAAHIRARERSTFVVH